MVQNESTGAGTRIHFKSLLPFFLLTFGLAWGILELYIFLPAQMTAIFGQLSGNHPLFFLAVYAPAIAAFIQVIRETGPNGLRLFLKRLLIWRCQASWAIFLLFGVPLVFYVGSAWKGNLFAEPFPFSSISSLFFALFLSVIKGPVEEFGWRGFALPLMQRRMAPIWAALLLGVIWGIWHMPAFLLSGTQQSAWSFLPFFSGTVTISVIMTALFNASRGSILLAAFFHFQLMNPVWPDAQPYDTYILVAVAVLVIFLNRENMFTRNNAVVAVVPSREGYQNQV
ncbi:MAG: CPBP family intramembrane metalloprotease [Candidatus Aminicenantes bacterium]|nr:CPBP family intramembrane metalloprotease [Candidatus Aminicenantes bacterium]